ncbi:MAG: outer membrane beta-barrel protein [Bacteroidales bacterium]|nr:outer membrane beta-barrel protein [Bacteroidales bacterium]
MSNKDWTDKLPDLLEDFTEAEPEGLWDAVQAGIAPKKRRIVVGWWYAGGALLAAAAVSAVFFLWPSKPVTPAVTAVPGDAVAAVESTAPVAKTPQNAPAEVPKVPLQSQNPPKTRPEECSAPQNPTQPEPSSVKTPEITDETLEPEPPSVKTPQNVDETPEPEASSVKTPEITDETPEPEPSSVKTPEITDETPEREAPRRRREPFRPSLKVQLGLSTTGYLADAAMSTTTGVGMPDNLGIRPGALPLTKSTSSGSSNESAMARMLSRNKVSTTDATHSQSVRLALGVTIGITDRWGLETGLVSSSLASRYETEAGGGREILTREMKYRGIPLYVRYNALQWRRLSLYLNAGPMYEYATKTMTEKSTVMGYVTTGHSIDNTLINDAKWSLNAGGGVQLRVLEHGALYVLPGVSYHFAGNSTLENFYTEHPFSASVTFGYNFVF